MSEDFDLNQEPRKVFVNFLIYNIKEIEGQLFFGGRTSLAIRGLRGLISSLDEKSQKALEKHYNKLMGYESNILMLESKTDLEKIYREVSAFLHNSYLKEAGVRALNPKPMHISRKKRDNNGKNQDE